METKEIIYDIIKNNINHANADIFTLVITLYMTYSVKVYL